MTRTATAVAAPELSRADEGNDGDGGGSTAEMVNDDGCNGGGERGSRRGGRGGARGADAGTTVAGVVLPSATVLPSAPAFVLPCWCCRRDEDDEKTKTETAENVTDWTEIVMKWHVASSR
uniref:Uncharacterized protein n=1 Tax=Oryza meridionalis TaxID=40149 RepID=A0A0E0D3C3_9ORYZ